MSNCRGVSCRSCDVAELNLGVVPQPGTVHLLLPLYGSVDCKRMAYQCVCVLLCTLSCFECALQHELKISVSSFLVCKKLRCCTFKMCWQENGDGHLLGLRRRFLFNTKKINTRNLNIKFVYRYHSFLSVKASKYWSGPFTFFLIFYTI